MVTHFAQREIAYSGAELRRGWLRDTFGLQGDAIAAFIGACDVAPEHMVDLEDRAAGARIFSRRMLHFIAEHEDPDLPRAILRQRLLVSITGECLQAPRTVGASPCARPLPAEATSPDGVGAVREPPLRCSRRRGGWATCDLRRCGDDLFWRGRKLSVSVATTSPTSGLIHLGLNIIAAGAPVPAAALPELDANPQELAEAVMAGYAAEMESVAAAQHKVRPVE